MTTGPDIKGISADLYGAQEMIKVYDRPSDDLKVNLSALINNILNQI